MLFFKTIQPPTYQGLMVLYAKNELANCLASNRCKTNY